MSQTSWQESLYNGLVVESGRPAKVSSGNITKPIIHQQVANHNVPSLEVFSDNTRNRGLLNRSKQRFSTHRAMSFLPQD